MSSLIDLDWFVGVQLFWLALLIFLNSFQLASAYFPMILVLLPTLGLALTTIIPNLSYYVTLAILTLFLALPTAYTNVIVAIVTTFFTPLMGRMGNVPVDIILGIIMGFLISLLLSMTTVFHGIVDNKRLRTVLSLVAVIFLVQSFFLTPYDFEHPKRLAGFHILREFHNASDYHSDSGIWTLAFDYLGMEAIRVPYLAELEHHRPGCYGLYCDLPFFYPVRPSSPNPLY